MRDFLAAYLSKVLGILLHIDSVVTCKNLIDYSIIWPIPLYLDIFSFMNNSLQFCLLHKITRCQQVSGVNQISLHVAILSVYRLLGYVTEQTTAVITVMRNSPYIVVHFIFHCLIMFLFICSGFLSFYCKYTLSFVFRRFVNC